MFRIAAAIKNKQNKVCENQPSLLGPLFQHFQQQAHERFVSLQGMEIRFERFDRSGCFRCLGQPECEMVADEFRRAGFQCELCEKEVLNPNSMSLEDCAFIRITSAEYDSNKLLEPTKHFATAKQWFEATQALAADWLAQELANKLASTCCSEVFDGPLEITLPAVPKFQTQNQAWFRFRLFEHSLKWISATTCYDASFSVVRNVHKIVFKLKLINSELQLAKTKNQAVLFSAVAIHSRSSSPAASVKQLDWTKLPGPAFEAIMAFLVGCDRARPQMRFQVTGQPEVNGTYAFYGIVESTSTNYRNLVFKRETLAGKEEEEEKEESGEVFLYRQAQQDCSPCGQELRWCLSSTPPESCVVAVAEGATAEQKQQQQPPKQNSYSYYVSKSSSFQSLPDADGWGVSTHGAAPAPRVQLVNNNNRQY